MREIQDSDEEIDHVEAEHSPAQQRDAPVPSREGDSRLDRGTGSTESLRNALQNEHQAQFQTQPSQVEPQSSVSLPGAPNRKRDISATPKPLLSRNKSSPKQNGPITYGERSKSTFSSPQSSDAKLVAEDPHSVPLQGDSWSLEGTMRENYAHHEPMAMFPEPSSTIANATQTQLHIMEALRAPTMGRMSSDTDVPQHLLSPEPSIPWSDMLKLTPGDPLYASGSSNQDERTSEPASAAPVSGGLGDEASASQKSRRGSSAVQKGSPLRHELARDGSQLLELTDRHAGESLMKNTTESPMVPTDTGRTRKDASASPTSHGKRRPFASLDDDDGISIGLPQEQYKPRPSRSRSLKADTEDTIDYSIIPERAKKKSKRRKTADVPSSVQIPTTPQKIKQICEMGFTPNTTRQALQQNNGDVGSTIDWLVTNGIGEDELASHNTPKKKSYTPKPQAPEIDAEQLQSITRDLSAYQKEDPPQDNATVSVSVDSALQPVSVDKDHVDGNLDTTPVKSSKVEVVIQKRSPDKATSTVQETLEPAKKKAKRRKTTLDQPDSEPSTAALELPAPVPEKKRGRGRPKKVVEVAASAESVKKIVAPRAAEEQQHEVLQAVEVNVASERNTVTELESNDAGPHRLSAISEEPAVTTPSKADNQSTKAQTPEATSNFATPSTKGKVPYRVGLSKRAKIAPLLRVLKK